MVWRIEIINRGDIFDAVGDGIRGDISDLGVDGVSSVRYIRLYSLSGNLAEAEAVRAAQDLLSDPVTQEFRCSRDGKLGLGKGQWGIEVWFKPGVTDNVGETTLKAMLDLGIQGVNTAITGRGYVIDGSLDDNAVERVCRRLLANDIIEDFTYYPG